MLALVNARVLLDDGFVAGRAVLVEGTRIAGIVGADDARARGAGRVDLAGAYLLPGFVDTQVNGGGGALFNDDPSIETIRRIGAAHRRFGTTAYLPTLISGACTIRRRSATSTRAMWRCSPRSESARRS